MWWKARRVSTLECRSHHAYQSDLQLQVWGQSLWNRVTPCYSLLLFLPKINSSKFSESSPHAPLFPCASASLPHILFLNQNHFQSKDKIRKMDVFDYLMSPSSSIKDYYKLNLGSSTYTIPYVHDMINH